MRFELVKFDGHWATFRHFPRKDGGLWENHTYIMPRDEFNARGKPGYIKIEVTHIV